MTPEQVADMFANAQHCHYKQKHRQQMQLGGQSKVQPWLLQQRTTSENLEQELSPQQFKITASSPEALNCKFSSLLFLPALFIFIEVRLGLQQFKLAAMEEGTLSSYVPVTMDELMSRFVLNLHRKEYNDAFEQSKKVLEQRDIRKLDNKVIAGSVDQSMTALQNLMFQDTIQHERLGNFQNGLFIKQLAKATLKHGLEMIRVDPEQKCTIIRK